MDVALACSLWAQSAVSFVVAVELNHPHQTPMQLDIGWKQNGHFDCETGTMETPARITVPDFAAMKGRPKIAMLTAYDFPTARLVDQAGADAILVGDSLAMVVQGRETTLPVTLDEMIYHAEMVGRAVSHALVIVDLPFPTYHVSTASAVDCAAQILKRTTCQAVKLEGGKEQASTIEALVTAGIPVMAHVGLRPQSIHHTGGYKVQRDAERLLEDARSAADAGAFSIVLECVPCEIAQTITAKLQIPTIGIGAGPDCDGQVLVWHDAMGYTDESAPRFVKPFADLRSMIQQAVSRYCDEVRRGEFPDESHSYK